MLVDVSCWHFEYLHDTPQDRALRAYDASLVRGPEYYDFPDTEALLKHLDGPGDDDRCRFQQSIAERLGQDPDVAAVKALRTPLKNLKHFRAYRRRQYDKYHAAARQIADGKASTTDRKLIDEFDLEFNASKISLDPGQILFHGRCNDQLVAEHPYPSYVSATLDPIVALNSAYRRAGVDCINGRPIVLVLKLCVSLRSLWGHVGKSQEWELLLPRGIDWKETERRPGKAFDIIHATAVAEPKRPKT
ncbi:sulfotransferase [Bradyrhizobium oligotrophicum S58]|uniref:Sulfotransferase n=1 Tax=Bradyrhizobium oligotrophicum S58 TaxID=1245469 RepID=M4Z9K6_9BRAD|nr:hypothetical protein [Bradyrhizobium oligotrophicum]BAM90404.1 sulfotransferase [Bradyrhizobium oligotrophicum S58]